MNARDLTNKRFGRLLVVRRDGRLQTYAAWICHCDCGRELRISSKNLKPGKESCGCLGKEKQLIAATVHGMHGTRVYNIWHSMVHRCTSHKNKDYYQKGVRVCIRWRSFENFYADMGEPPTAVHQIDRYPVSNGNYEPGNVRWATPREQALNRTNVKHIAYAGETLCLADWVRKSGMSESGFKKRLRTMSFAEAMSRPHRSKKKQALAALLREAKDCGIRSGRLQAEMGKGRVVG